MAIGKTIPNHGHVLGFREEILKAANASEDSFFTWFDAAKNKDAAFIRGSWDFSIHIAAPSAKYISEPEEKVALEIGYGGGRLIAAASRYFKTVIGVDIHDQQQKVSDELRKRNITNICLLKTAGTSLPVESSSVDFIYSFIVLQHVEKYQYFKRYMDETSRVLRTNGIAVLYFGRRCFFSENRSSRLLLWIDRILEPIALLYGYEEIAAKVNEINLRISLSHAKSIAERVGLDILSSLVSRKKVPDGIRLFGAQNGLVLKKR